MRHGSNNGHLVMHERHVAPAEEWAPGLRGWVFLSVATGEGYLMRAPSPQPLTEGDLLVLPQQAACPLRASQLGPMIVRFFEVCPRLLVGVLSVYERSQLETAGRLANRKLQFYPAPDPLAQRATALFQQATQGENMLVRAQMLQLAAPLLSQAVPPQPADLNATLTARERFDRLLQQMTDSQLHEYNLAELAQLCGCSERHFSRLYRDTFGHSLLHKKIDLRFQKAQQVLADTDDKIIDVALDCGFQHVGLFTSMFKKRFRATPSQWRRRKRRAKQAV